MLYIVVNLDKSNYEKKKDIIFKKTDRVWEFIECKVAIEELFEFIDNILFSVMQYPDRNHYIFTRSYFVLKYISLAKPVVDERIEIHIEEYMKGELRYELPTTREFTSKYIEHEWLCNAMGNYLFDLECQK